MKREDVLPFVERRWDLALDEKRIARAERFWREGPIGCLRGIEAMMQAAKQRGLATDREADYERHVRVRAALARAEAARVGGR